MLTRAQLVSGHFGVCALQREDAVGLGGAFQGEGWASAGPDSVSSTYITG